MIQSGTLDERIEVLAQAVTRARSGAQTIAYNSIGSRWASVKFLKGARALSSEEVYMASSIAVTMRPMNGLVESCRLVWRSKTYRIESLNYSRSDGIVHITASVIDINEPTTTTNTTTTTTP